MAFYLLHNTTENFETIHFLEVFKLRSELKNFCPGFHSYGISEILYPEVTNISEKARPYCSCS